MKHYLLIFLLLCSVSFASNPVFTYEPVKVTLSGSLDLQTFPGPPNYENINEGDDIERHFYLKLDSPVDVIPRKEGHATVVNPELERNVRVMMLAIPGEDDVLWSQFRKAGKGAEVKIFGTLYHRWTGHHHSRVIFAVEKMELLR